MFHKNNNSMIDVISHIKVFEGFRSKAYKCPSGVLTIGYGHTYGVLPNMVVNEFQATELLLFDIEISKLQLLTLHPDFLGFSLGLYWCLIDFVFNVGITKYKNSTLRKVVDSIKDCSNLTENDIASLSVQLNLWCYAKGKKLRGLEKRRSFEISLLYENEL